MAEEIEALTPETAESGESSEQAAARRLDDATFEPQALIEQTGDYRQAEQLQGGLEDMIRSAGEGSDPGRQTQIDSIRRTVVGKEGGADPEASAPVQSNREREGAGIA